jgi:hypothetical protein
MTAHGRNRPEERERGKPIRFTSPFAGVLLFKLRGAIRLLRALGPERSERRIHRQFDSFNYSQAQVMIQQLEDIPCYLLDPNVVQLH